MAWQRKGGFNTTWMPKDCLGWVMLGLVSQTLEEGCGKWLCVLRAASPGVAANLPSSHLREGGHTALELSPPPCSLCIWEMCSAVDTYFSLNVDIQDPVLSHKAVRLFGLAGTKWELKGFSAGGVGPGKRRKYCPSRREIMAGPWRLGG